MGILSYIIVLDFMYKKYQEIIIIIYHMHKSFSQILRKISHILHQCVIYLWLYTPHFMIFLHYLVQNLSVITGNGNPENHNIHLDRFLVKFFIQTYQYFVPNIISFFTYTSDLYWCIYRYTNSLMGYLSPH